MNYWFVGSHIAYKDYTKSFVKAGIWRIELDETDNNYSKDNEKFNEIQVGDKIAIKAVYVRKNDLPFSNPRNKSASVMKIKAIGEVKTIKTDNALVVDWYDNFKEKDWYFYTYRPTIWKVNPDKSEWSKLLVDFTFDNQPQDYQKFIQDDYWHKRWGDIEEPRFSEEEIKEFKDYFDSTFKIIQDSTDNSQRSSKGNLFNNFVTDASKPKLHIQDKEISRRIEAGINILSDFPYINIFQVNLFYDRKKQIFDKNQVFVGVSSKYEKKYPSSFKDLPKVTQNSPQKYYQKFELLEDKLSLKNEEDYEKVLYSLFEIDDELKKQENESVTDEKNKQT